MAAATRGISVKWNVTSPREVVQGLRAGSTTASVSGTELASPPPTHKIALTVVWLPLCLQPCFIVPVRKVIVLHLVISLILLRKDLSMGIFSNILEKLGLPHQAESAAPATPASPESGTNPGAVATASPRRSAVGVVDVVAHLEARAAASQDKLNWRTSIVDLLKLLDIDSSLTARKQLATELGCPPELMGDSAKMNIWLHKAVLEHIAANGGIIPQELLG